MQGVFQDVEILRRAVGWVIIGSSHQRRCRQIADGPVIQSLEVYPQISALKLPCNVGFYLITAIARKTCLARAFAFAPETAEVKAGIF